MNRIRTMDWSAAYRVSCLLIVFGVLGRVDRGAATCTLPSGLYGYWLRSSDNKVLNIMAPNVTGHLLTDRSNRAFSYFTCQQDTGNGIFILGDMDIAHNNPLNSNEQFYTVFCWQLVRVSDITYLLYELTSLLLKNDLSFPSQRVYKQNSSNPVLDTSAICSLSSSTQNPTILFKVVSGARDIDPAAIAKASQTCPKDIVATYSYVVDGAGCRDNETELDFCVDPTTAKANYTLCPTEIMFSKNGLVSCLFSFQLFNSLYILFANEDDGSVLDNQNYFRFSCMVVNSTPGSAKTALIYAGPCDRTDKNQTLGLTRTASCSPDVADESSLNIIPIIAGVVAGVVVVTLIVVIVVLVVKMRARRFRVLTPSVPPKAEHAQNGEAHGPVNGQPSEQTDQQQQTTANGGRPLPDLPTTETPRGGPEKVLRLPPLEGAPKALSVPLRS